MTSDLATLVSDNLDVWTSAIERKSGPGRGAGKKFSHYGIERLRALILDLAVRGKLVPQDAEHSPAAELLKDIEAEKLRLFRRSAAKRMAPVKAPAAWPFEIPESWVWSQIGTITNYGETQKADPGEVDDDTWVLELEDVEKGSSKLLEKIRYSSRQFQSQKNRFRPGDVIYGKLRPYLDKVLIADEAGVCTTEMVPVRGYHALEPAYLRWYLKSPFFIRFADSSTHGMNLPRVGTDKARVAPIALPPVAEQQRIVAKVDELMAQCDALEAESASALEAHQALVETLLATLVSAADPADLARQWARLETQFDTLFTTSASVKALQQTVLELAVRGKLATQDASDQPAGVMLSALKKATLKGASKSKAHPSITSQEQPFALPAGWKWERFDNLMRPDMPIAYGVLVPGDDVPNGVPFVRIADLSIDNPPPLPEKSISAEVDEQYVRTRLKGGEILMGVVGSIGKLGVAPVSWANANIARAICRIVPSDDVDRGFVLWLLQSRFMQNGFRGDTRTLAQPTLNIGLIRLAPTPVPPLAEQKRIVAKLDELMGQCEALRARIADTEQTRKHLADAVVERVAA
ncbi:restriction endonuclease subunit S [Brevundimonas sp. R86498]|uniref:restriction endonuclease subunit S n=1 Tax=Brevundimonas sp. R86498 TaxID=3093845 RepID=UPI0037CC21BC